MAKNHQNVYRRDEYCQRWRKKKHTDLPKTEIEIKNSRITSQRRFREVDYTRKAMSSGARANLIERRYTEMKGRRIKCGRKTE